MLSDANVIIAPFGAALEAFEGAGKQGVMKALDYPIAHHRYSDLLLSAEAERIPEFACTLQWRNLSKALERRLDKECELADLILTGSAFARDSFIEQGVSPSKVLAIPYGVDSGKFRPRGPQTIDEAFRVLFVGSIGQRKGISYLLDGYSRFAKSNTELMLVGNYVGDGKAFRPYHRLYTHVPHAPHSMMPEIFSAASVFVFPSLLEGLGIVVLEAMAAGLPVIVTPNGPGHVVRDGVDGYVVPAGDSEAIKNRLELLYNDLPLRNRMALSARERAMEFSWGNHSRQVIDAMRLGLSDSRKSAVRSPGDNDPAEGT
jgi:glycosyltransferase involved in cell wall biosynthesis